MSHAFEKPEILVYSTSGFFMVLVRIPLQQWMETFLPECRKYVILGIGADGIIKGMEVMKEKNVEMVAENTQEINVAKEQNTEANKIEKTEIVQEQGTTEKKKKSLKVPVIVGAVIVLVLLTAVGILYGRNAAFYQTHFFPNTTVNGTDCSKFGAVQVISMINDRIQEYTLEVVGRLNEDGEIGILGTIRTKDIGL